MENEILDLPVHTTSNEYSSNVDTSRPFRSVKEAVAIFGERFLVGEIYSSTPKPNYSTSYYSPPTKHETSSWPKYSSSSSLSTPINHKHQDFNQQHDFLETLKKLETELEETKTELKQLKERESETEISLATLNAELHKNMSKLAEAEAAAAKKARTTGFEEDRRRSDLMKRMADSPTLAEILRIGEDGYFGGKKEKKTTTKKKIKPIVPLVSDLFSFKKKGSSETSLQNPLYASPNMYFN